MLLAPDYPDSASDFDHESSLPTRRIAFVTVSALPTITMSIAAEGINGEGGRAVWRIDPERSGAPARRLTRRTARLCDDGIRHRA